MNHDSFDEEELPPRLRPWPQSNLPEDIIFYQLVNYPETPPLLLGHNSL